MPRRGGSKSLDRGRGGGGRGRAWDPFDQFDDVFRNNPFFAKAFRSMDDLFVSRFDAGGWQQQGQQAGAEESGGI